MATTSATSAGTSELAVFARLLRHGKKAMSRELARHVLTLGFDKEDQARMDDLAARNQNGALSAAERQELMNFVKAGHLLALLHSVARKTVSKKNVS